MDAKKVVPMRATGVATGGAAGVQAPGGRWDGLHLDLLLALDAAGDNLFRSRYGEDNRNGRVFGGQLLGQALQAARAGVDPDRQPSALQVLFMNGAAVDRPVDYRVERMQEGKRFSSRRVHASQDGRGVIDAHASFAAPLAGNGHALPPPLSYPAPEDVLPMAELAARAGPRYAGIDWPVFEKPCLELRIVDPDHHLVGASPAPRMAFWVKLRAPLGDDPAMHAAALAYLSDYWINSAAITHHIPARDAHAATYIASLNHALWFHSAGRAEDWLLFACESPAMQQGRALSSARIYARDGTLLASVMQECLFVPR
ncbi:MAG: acyl-CoA thioesterase domain-containing protein [Pseudomonadota bacterium]